MKLKAVLLLPVIAVLALPGEAKQPVVTPEARLVAMQGQLGFDLDPNLPVGLKIVMPAGFTTFDTTTDPFPTARV